MISCTDLAFNEQMFTYHDLDSDRIVDIASARLAAYCVAVREPIVLISIEKTQALTIRQRVEPHRMARLTPAALDSPMLFIDFPSGESSLIDGSHRYVYHWQLGKTTGKAWRVAPATWQRFLISGLPQPISTKDFIREFYKVPSGVL